MEPGPQHGLHPRARTLEGVVGVDHAGLLPTGVVDVLVDELVDDVHRRVVLLGADAAAEVAERAGGLVLERGPVLLDVAGGRVEVAAGLVEHPVVGAKLHVGHGSISCQWWSCWDVMGQCWGTVLRC